MAAPQANEAAGCAWPKRTEPRLMHMPSRPSRPSNTRIWVAGVHRGHGLAGNGPRAPWGGGVATWGGLLVRSVSSRAPRATYEVTTKPCVDRSTVDRIASRP